MKFYKPYQKLFRMYTKLYQDFKNLKKSKEENEQILMSFIKNESPRKIKGIDRDIYNILYSIEKTT